METRLVSIEFGEGQRTRRVVSRSNHRVTGKYPSWKRKCMVHWESQIEHDAFRRLDADSSVITYEEQPAKIIYEVGDKTLTHYPDILVTWTTSRGFLEVKTDKDADSPEIRERTAIMVSLLLQAGFSYRVWRESEIRTQPALVNDTQLLTLGRKPVPLVERERIRRLFAETPVIPWEILSKIGIDGAAHAARMVIEGMLIIDRTKPLTGSSTVRFNETVWSLS